MKRNKVKVLTAEEIALKEIEKKEARKRSSELKKQKEIDKLLREKTIAEFRDKHSVVLANIANRMFVTKDIKYVIHSGKTNSGKTYNAIETLKKNGSGIYLAPLRLLAFEIQDKLRNSGYSCSLITGEEQIIIENSKYTSSTIEMLNYSKFYDTVVIDEAFMINDQDRGKSWTRAILDTNAREIHIIVNEEGLDMIEKLLKFSNRNYEVKKYEMLQKFKFSDSTTQMSKKLAKGTVFVTFSRINVLISKMKLEKLGYNVSVLYGNLPPEVKKVQIERFVSGESTVMVTTDVIGMGINLPANSIIFLETEKFDGTNKRKLTSSEIKQIAGRTGRYGISNDDSYVSATNKNDLDFIKNNYAKFNYVNKAYIGLDYEMFSSFDENMSVIDRINNYNLIDFIPENMKFFLHKESIFKYVDVARTVDRKNFTLNVKWIFLTAPIKANNRDYFNSCVHHYEHNGTIIPPTIIKHYDAKGIEDNISEIDLYLSLSRSLNHDEVVLENYKLKKYELIEKLTNMLLDKKLSSTKKCALCNNRISITDPYKYCGNCYETKIRVDYDDFNSYY